MPADGSHLEPARVLLREEDGQRECVAQVEAPQLTSRCLGRQKPPSSDGALDLPYGVLSDVTNACSQTKGSRTLRLGNMQSIVSAETLNAPDLSKHCGRNTEIAVRRNYFTGHGLQERPARPLLTRLIALTDRSCRQYEAARACLSTYVEREGNEWRYTAFIFEASDHLEIAIVALDGAVRHAHALRRQPGVPEVPSSEFLSGHATTRISRLRNAAEHFDKDLASGRTPKDAAVLVVPHAEGFEFADCEVLYDCLAGWITKMVRLAGRYVDHDPYAGQRPGSEGA